MEIDIRGNDGLKEITVVRFASDQHVDGCGQADCLRREPLCLGESQVVRIVESDNEDFVRIYSAEHARNLIKALEYAIDNSWLK